VDRVLLEPARSIVGRAEAIDREGFARFFRGMIARGVLLPPSAFESAFLSWAHDDAIIEETITAARSAFAEVRS
jgi:glutamate-1-semialdehyde 2,1-aminomutase